MTEQVTAELRLERWSDGDLELVRRANTPEMWAHLGGPETEGQVLARHQRFLRAGGPGGGGMFRVVRAPDAAPVGMVGYWERVWHDEAVYEAGWQVLTEYQGRGIAGAAVALLLDHAATHAASRAVHAFPSVDNTPSNALCRKLGFVRAGECGFEFPRGHQMRCNDWRWGPPAVT